MLRSACQKLIRCKTLIDQPCYRNLSASYKSKISLENLYPNSDQNHIAHVSLKHTTTDSSEDRTKLDVQDEPFTGYIPMGDVDISYSRSSGAGGQNVNKVNTKVEIRFNVDEAEWIPDWIKPKLKEQEEGRITKDGVLIMKSEKTRKQILNQADCLDKIRHIVFKASIKPKEPTTEELALIEKRQQIASKKRLEEKRRNALRRQNRKVDFY